MSNRICGRCKSSVVVPWGDVKDFYKCMNCSAMGYAEKFPEKTLFTQITESPETLAEILVYAITGYCSVGAVKHWYSALELGTYFSKREEALVATIEKLKEVAE